MIVVPVSSAADEHALSWLVEAGPASASTYVCDRRAAGVGELADAPRFAQTCECVQ
jgi:hypothetical protein